MPATRNHLGISRGRADALFVSALQPSERPSARQVYQAIAAAVRQFGDLGCAARVAQEFGEHPELAAARMRWARRIVAGASGESRPRELGAPSVCREAARASSWPLGRERS
jgi:hypothetical protein